MNGSISYSSESSTRLNPYRTDINMLYEPIMLRNVPSSPLPTQVPMARDETETAAFGAMVEEELSQRSGLGRAFLWTRRVEPKQVIMC